ncbi:HNH endonuclease [Subsaximicrobium wynnwilliamsii]|uniref:HNH endonuclease n=1 Tax=Subsaximicrobium wynnwilliamsii TaxID=291179 RepID=A0A5C6ZI19_9FLAO|nr:HNH endonuclease [Subsaximicrobium wynnwilliamsii]TXD84160.1 HNH endonuclease [Subsaximicrobium wynnwilliamsii]TXD89781.1 HNH endonuclease [Subsaximicrobium wynnwilliamsii]TXE03872.1 HNH endonuclease [Subsaximicrobium wynnwilliamsii]
MIRNYYKEEWKVIQFDEKIAENQKFKISNYGRLLKCSGPEEILVKQYYINGYQNLPIKQKLNGKQTSRYVHKLVAQHFLDKNDGVCVIHRDYDKTNNHIDNLKWATKREKEIHQFTNPEYKNRKRRIPYNAKLTETKVKLIKRKLNDPNRRTRLKMIAKQFGISEMQLHRIKTGENWGYVDAY